MDFNLHELETIINALEYIKNEFGNDFEFANKSSLDNALFKAKNNLELLKQEIKEYEQKCMELEEERRLREF